MQYPYISINVVENGHKPLTDKRWRHVHSTKCIAIQEQMTVE